MIWEPSTCFALFDRLPQTGCCVHIGTAETCSAAPSCLPAETSLPMCGDALRASISSFRQLTLFLLGLELSAGTSAHRQLGPRPSKPPVKSFHLVIG